jgi:hypothetical protein
MARWKRAQGGSFLQFPAGALKLLGDEFLFRKDSLTLSGEHLGGEIVECVVGLRRSANFRLWLLLSRTDPERNRRNRIYSDSGGPTPT